MPNGPLREPFAAVHGRTQKNAAAVFACQQLQLDAMGMQAPAAAGRESSAPRPYIGYILTPFKTNGDALRPPLQIEAKRYLNANIIA